MTRKVSILAVALLFTGLTVARATVSVTSLYSSNMVLQRNKPVPVWGRASANKTITVIYNGQTKTTTSDAQGNWLLYLDAMAAKTTGSNMTVNEAGANTLTFTNVVVGDVWICSGQSNMAFSLSGCNRQSDIDAANYPGIRHFWVPLVTSSDPQRTVTGSWTVCSPSTAAGFSAVAFYFGRKIYTDQSSAIPIGLVASTVGGTCIDPWLAQEGETDISVLSPLYSQSVMPWGPFSLANGMIHPLAPLACKGAIWYQGENRETTSQSNDSYYLKEKGLQQGWKRLCGLDDFALYIVLLANWGTPNTSVTPDSIPAATWADTRIQQVNVVGLPHAGIGSALDVGNPDDIHPTDKLDVGERLAYWALKNDYGRTIVPSGPILNNVTISGSTLICSFDYVGDKLMVGSKTPYLPTTEVIGGTLTNFSIAGASGSWYAATATINADNTITVSSPSVTTPRKVAYACWQSPNGPNLYNKVTLSGVSDGLPANPFYVDDATAKYTVTATAGAGGSISPTGTTTYLKRKTALYTITPDSGYYIQNVTVDSVSVGAVKYYTFDPLYANHTINATFASSAPTFTVTSSSSSGGSISPLGAQTVTQGGSKTFTITPNSGCQIASVTVDGGAMGKRASFTFSDVRANHTISATFACTITSSANFGGTISPSGPITVNYSSNQTFTIAPLSGYSISSVVVDGVGVGAVSSYTFTNVITNHTISASFSGGTGGVGSIPQTSQIIFSALASSLPSSGNISSWSTNYPSGQSLAIIGSPSAETINGRKWEKNVNVDGDGFRFGGSYSSSIACTGASIVAAVRPARITGDSGNWRSIVDVFYDRMVLGLTNDGGLVNVRRNGSLDFSSSAVPDGQMTILSLVVQSTGTYKVWANGTLMMNNTSTSDMTALVPGVTGGAGGYGTYINVGRNNPDGWTTFNGNIGDVFLYKTALTDAERGQLEQYIGNKLSDYTITASAGAGGSISPPGATTLPSGSNQTYTITPNTGYNISGVSVDGVNQGAISSYTFSNLSASHTISATFSQITYTIAASAGANGSISPSGAVSVNHGTNRAFTITPNAGYAIAGLKVDSAPVTPSVSYTFSNVTANHTIAATFAKPVGMNNKAALTDVNVPGRPIKIWGKIKSVNGSTFVMSGYTYKDEITKVAVVVDVNVSVNNAVLPTGFGVDKFVTVTGVMGSDRTVQAQQITVAA